VQAGNAVYSSVNGVLFGPGLNTLIQYPGGLAGDYTIPGGVGSIADGSFYVCPSLTGVTIPSSVAYIGVQAFFECTNLSNVYFYGNAPAVDPSAFNGDTNATVYYLPGTTGWGSTFAGCPTALWLPEMETSNGSFGLGTNGFGFTINWASGMTVVVEAAANLANPTWIPLATNTLSSTSFYFNDPEWTRYPSRFYRLSMP
jgi:hypothetical protein